MKAHPKRGLARRRLTGSLPLPHERDESADATAVRQPAIKQAARDLDAGQVDTDNYTRALSITSAPKYRRRLKP